MRFGRESNDWGTHHSKAFILQYPLGLRVIVHTANLIEIDCHNKTQVMHPSFTLRRRGRARGPWEIEPSKERHGEKERGGGVS